MSIQLDDCAFTRRGMLRDNTILDTVLGGFLGGFTALCVVIPNSEIMGIGIAVFPFVFLLFYAGLVVVGFNRWLSSSDYLKSGVAHYLCYCSAMLFAFVVNGDITTSSLHYVISLVSNMAWVVIFILASKNMPTFFRAFSVSFFFALVSLLTVQWLLGFYANLDPFYLRLDMTDGPENDPSLTANPNAFARVVVSTIPLTLFYMHSRQKKWWGRYLIKGIFLFLCFCVVSTLSRANMAALVLFFFFWVWLLFPFKIMILVKSSAVMLAVLITMIVAIPAVGERISQTVNMLDIASDALSQGDNQMLPIRIRTWAATISTVRENPFFGVGVSKIDMYQEKFGAIKSHRGIEETISVHGGFLKTAAYGGLIALLLLVLFLRRVWRVARLALNTEPKLGEVWRAALSLLLFIVVLIPMNIGADSLGQPYIWIVLGILLATLIRRNNRGGKYAQKERISA